MPRTFGRNVLHLSQVAGWCEVDRPLSRSAGRARRRRPPHRRAVAERIPDGACIQAGIGSIPNGVLAALRGHRDLGIHTELLSDGVVDLVEAGVATGIHKVRRPGKVVDDLRPRHPAACTTSSTATPPSSCSPSTG